MATGLPLSSVHGCADVLVVGVGDYSWIHACLEGAGYGVRGVTSVAEALTALAGRPPDLIILGAGFPNPDDAESIRRLEQEATRATIPILLVSAQRDPVPQARDGEAGALDSRAQMSAEAHLLARAGMLLTRHVYSERRAERARLDLLRRASLELSAELDLDTLLARILDLTSAALDSSRGSLILLDEQGCAGRGLISCQGGTATVAPGVWKRVVEEGLAGWVIAHRRGICLSDARGDPRWIVPAEVHTPVGSALSVPLIHAGHVVGVLTLTHEQPGHFVEEHVPLLEIIAPQVTIALQNSRLLQETELQRRLKDEFVAAVSHDLHSPLTTIRGFAELLLELTQGEARDLAQRIKAGAEEMTALVDDLLSLARIEAGVDQGRQACQVERLVAEAGARAGFLAQASAITLEIAVLVAVPPVRGNAQWLRRALDNLLCNAIKYTPAGGRVTVRLRQEDSRVIVEVQDTGIGIPREALPRLFEKFYRAPRPETRDIPGTGLGLCIARAIVEQHGGKIWVESEPGRGSTFGFSLPCGDAETAAAPAHTGAGNAGSSTPVGPV